MYKCYIILELMVLKVFMLMIQVHPKNALFVTNGILNRGFRLQPTFCYSFYDILMLSIEIKSFVLY